MSDLIKRQDAIEACRSVANNINSPTDQQIGAEYCLDLIKEIPPVELERKTGKWIVTSEFEDCCYYKCNQCKVSQVFYYKKLPTNFCPNCGAKMER